MAEWKLGVNEDVPLTATLIDDQEVEFCRTHADINPDAYLTDESFEYDKVRIVFPSACHFFVRNPC